MESSAVDLTRESSAEADEVELDYLGDSSNLELVISGEPLLSLMPEDLPESGAQKRSRTVSFGNKDGAAGHGSPKCCVRGGKRLGKLNLQNDTQITLPHQEAIEFDYDDGYGQPGGQPGSEGQPPRVSDDGGGRASTIRHFPQRDRSCSENWDSLTRDLINPSTTPKPSTSPRRLNSVKNTTKKPHISLHKAVQDNKVEIVKQWLAFNKDHPHRNRRKDKHGFAPIHYAAKFNRPKIMTMLCDESGVDVCERTISEEYTPLHLAARFNPACSQEFGESLREECDHRPSVVADDGELTVPAPFQRQNSIEEVFSLLLKQHQVDVNVIDKLHITPLHLACQVGNKEAVELLLKRSKVVLAPYDVNGDTPLHEACLHGQAEVVEILLNKMVDSRRSMAEYMTKNNLGLTPFHLACRQGHFQIIKMLFKHFHSECALITTVDGEKSTPLHLACESGNKDIVQLLVKHDPHLIDELNDNGVTPVHIAAQCGSIEVMEKLLRCGEKAEIIDKKDKYSQTPLHHAAEYGKVDMIIFLLKMNATVNARDIDNYIPLMTAAEFGQEKAFVTLVNHGAELDAVNKSGKSVLFLAAKSNHANIITKVIVHIKLQEDMSQEISVPNFDISQLCSKTDTCMCNPLHVAAEMGHLEPLKLLLEHVHATKEVVDAKDIVGRTVMHFAAENGHVSIVGLLRQYCPHQVQSTDEKGNTPLHLACTNGFVDVAKILIRMEGSDIGARNEILWTPIDCAASKGHARVIQELVMAKAEIDPKDKLKTTPLHLAAKEGHVAAVETLLKYNASVSSRDHRGFNALDWAIENGHRDVADVIIKSKVWKYALRNHTTEQDGRETTPFRKLIQRMPDIAELVLKKCTTTNAKSSGVKPASEDYCVTFNYEFLEDREHAEEWREDAKSQIQDTLQEPQSSRYTEKKPSKWHTSSSKSGLTHPLQVMVDSKRVDLLKHPLVYKLIEHKWNTCGRAIFWLMLLFHVVFVIFLTTYALVLPNPFSETCVAVTSNKFNLAQEGNFVSLNITDLSASQSEAAVKFALNQSSVMEGNIANISSHVLCTNATPELLDAVPSINAICGRCDLSRHELKFVLSAAIIIIFLSLCQIVVEILQVLHEGLLYLKDLASWIKIPQIVSTICFAATFGSTCYCPKQWQWQVGVVAVFLVWIDLILYVRKFRVLDTGIYILMFETIFRRFLRLIILSVLLVSTFGITFYMAFNHLHPYFHNSPFAHPFHSMWKIMTMTIGELDYDNAFRQFSEGTDAPIQPLPFPEISYILWAVFLILMPILFNNLLVALAVDDIKGILEMAALTRLTLRVKLILSLEERVYSFEQHCPCGQLTKSQCPSVLKVYPYKRHWKGKYSLLLRLWRGKDYSSSKNLSQVLNPTQTLLEQQTHSLIREMSKMHDSIQQIPAIHDSLHQMHNNLQQMQETLQTLANEVESLKSASKPGSTQSI